MLVTGEPMHIPLKARELVAGMLVPVARLVDGRIRTVASRVVAVSRSYDLVTVYWQLEDDPPDWCWSATADTYLTVVTCVDQGVTQALAKADETVETGQRSHTNGAGVWMSREPTDQIQRGRARQYALCTIALRHDRLGAGAEGVFDQALTNGLAAIVAHSWPGRERNQKNGRVLPARELLRVIEGAGRTADADGVVRVLHDPAGPEYGTGFLAELLPNFTSVRVGVLRAAIDATQVIRHARDTGQDTPAVLTEEQIDAMVDLDYHPALSAIGAAMQADYELGVAAVDRAAQRRAAEYLDLLDGEEYQRRAVIDYGARYRDGETDVEQCPVCGNVSLVASAWDGLIAEVGIGQCVVCGYVRSGMVAEEIAGERQFRRALDRRD